MRHFLRFFASTILIAISASCSNAGGQIAGADTDTIDIDAIAENGIDPLREVLKNGDKNTVLIVGDHANLDLQAIFTSAAYVGSHDVRFDGEQGASKQAFEQALKLHLANPPNVASARKIAAALEHDPIAGKILTENPEIVLGWTADYWAEAILESPQYSDQPWRVHDMRRPQPVPIKPGMAACAGVSKPEAAEMIFDGRSKDGFTGPMLDAWHVSNGSLVPSGRTNNRIASKRSYTNVHIHLEFKMPIPTRGYGQHRGNSGLFLMGLYEVQILDSHENPTTPDGTMGALYGQRPPLANASLPPGVWQCMDVVFTAPKFEDGTLKEPAYATVLINGVVVQANAQFYGPTAFSTVSQYDPHSNELPFTLQDHGDLGGKIHFRNIWAQRLDFGERKSKGTSD